MTDTRWQLIVYVFASVTLWVVAAQLSRRRSPLSKGWAASILRFGYYIGLPYAALILGVVPGRYLGLVGLDRLQARDSATPGLEPGTGIWHLLSQVRDDISLVVLDWLPDVGTIAGLGVVMLLLLSVTWLGYAYLRRGAISGPGTHLPSKLSGMQVVYQAIHWSFYRSAVWLLTDDLYLGVVGGILLVGGEWALDPGWAHGAGHTLSREKLLIDASVLIATSVIFFFVPNLWLLLPIHWLLAMTSRRMVAWRQWQMAGSQ